MTDTLPDAAPDRLQPHAARAAASGTDIPTALEIARELGAQVPWPGRGETLQRWAMLAALARENVTVARVAEAHLDALAILAEAEEDTEKAEDEPGRGPAWGVFAAEGSDEPLRAEAAGHTVTLHGHKPWCSLGNVLDTALVTAREGERSRLFQVALDHPGVNVRPASGWVARGLPSVVSVGIDFAGVPAHPVGPVEWYLTRPGFAWGGIGVAACWYGAACGVADHLRSRATGDIRRMHLGRTEAALHAADCVLRDAARRVDGGQANGADGAELALRVRAVVAETAETVLREVGHACGPAPLAFDERHAARVADLGLYVRQHHAERDLAALGRVQVERDECRAERRETT